MHSCTGDQEEKEGPVGMDQCTQRGLLRLIALSPPMAKDMRIIACSLRLIASAERIGRYGKDIANVVLGTYSRHGRLMTSSGHFPFPTWHHW